MVKQKDREIEIRDVGENKKNDKKINRKDDKRDSQKNIC